MLDDDQLSTYMAKPTNSKMMFEFLRSILRSETATELLDSLVQFPPNEGCDIIALRRCVFDSDGLPRLEPEAFWSKRDVDPWEQTIHIDDDSLAQIWILSGGPPIFVESLDDFALFTGESRRFHQEQGIVSLYHILVQRHENISAVVSVLWRTPNTFSDEYKAMIEFAGLILAPVVENIFLHRQNNAMTMTIKVLEQRLHDKDVEMQSLVHDLKQPITSIISTANLLYNYLDRLDKDQITAKLKRISDTSWGMSDWITSILLLAQVRGMEPVEIVSVNMQEALRNTIESLQELIDRSSATIRFSTPLDNLPPIRANPTWVQHIWANFISNACKYGGMPPVITIGAVNLNGSVQFTIQDNGQGIPPDKLKSIFEPFVRLEAHALKKAGTGVGLTTAKLLIENQGGEVGVLSDFEGSTFWFTLHKSLESPAA